MTPGELAEIEERLEKATPAPMWKALLPLRPTPFMKSDMDFIVHAPEDIRTLLDALEETERKLSDLEARFYTKMCCEIVSAEEASA